MHVVKTNEREREPWEDSLSITIKGATESTVGNAVLILSNHPDWQGIRYNKFTQITTIDNAPGVPGFARPKPELDDYSAAYISQWLSRYQRIKLREGDVIKAANAAGKQPRRAYHPVREYLDSVEWDGVSRIGAWLTDYLHVDANPYSSAVGRMWMISAVARVMEPGCQADHMLLFEGSQGTGKSSALRALTGDKWFLDSRIDLGSKDGFEVLRGKWIVEAAELDSFKGRDATRVKSFITSRVDTFRKSYGSSSEDISRQCVIAGSTNESFYLNDPTGNRRFWPVRAKGKVLINEIAASRDQLWAEAYSEFLDGKAWHIKDPALLEIAEGEQAKREVEHPWEGVIYGWVEKNGSIVAQGVSIGAVCNLALSIDVKDMGNHGTPARVGHILAKLGMVVKPGSENERPRKFYRPEDLEERVNETSELLNEEW